MLVTQELLLKHRHGHSFVMAANPQISLRMSDISAVWRINKDIVVHTGYRLIGTRDQLNNALTNLKLDIQTVIAILNTVITYDNHTSTMKEVFDAEVESYWKFLNSAISSQQTQPVSEPTILQPNYGMQQPTAPFLQPIFDTAHPTGLQPNDGITPKRRPVPQAMRPTSHILDPTGAKAQPRMSAQPIQPAVLTVTVDPERFEDITGDVDVFDFATYKEDYDLFSKYFQSVELYLRLANWNTYKYCYMTKIKDKEELDENLRFVQKIVDGTPVRVSRTDEEIKEWLVLMTDLFETDQVVWSWFKHFRPEKLDNVWRTLEKYSSHIGLLFNRLYRAHVDKEHQDQKLWF